MVSWTNDVLPFIGSTYTTAQIIKAVEREDSDFCFQFAGRDEMPKWMPRMELSQK